MNMGTLKTIEKLRNKQPVVICVVGDSNSVVSFNTHGRMNWVGYLTEALWTTYGDDLVTMINVSRCGYSFGACLAELERRVLRWHPDLVIFALGINDSSAGEAGLAKAKDTVRTLVHEIRTKTGAEILFRTPNPVVYGYWQPLPPDAKPGEPYEAGTYATSAFAAALVALANELDCPVCDHYSAWKRKKYHFGHPGANPQGLRLRMSDVIHPNDVGHLAFFRELAPHFNVPKYFPWEEADLETT